MRYTAGTCTSVRISAQRRQIHSAVLRLAHGLLAERAAENGAAAELLNEQTPLSGGITSGATPAAATDRYAEGCEVMSV